METRELFPFGHPAGPDDVVDREPFRAGLQVGPRERGRPGHPVPVVVGQGFPHGEPGATEEPGPARGLAVGHLRLQHRHQEGFVARFGRLAVGDGLRAQRQAPARRRDPVPGAEPGRGWGSQDGASAGASQRS